MLPNLLPAKLPSRALFARLLALCIGLMAVLAGLAMPVSMLAADLRSGNLSGICTSQSAAQSGNSNSSDSSDSSNAPSPTTKQGPACDTCGFLAWLPFLPAPAAALSPGLLAWLGTPGNADPRLPALWLGLPPSRAPPLV